MSKDTPEIALIMGSQSDWSVMIAASNILQELGISCDARIISAHRTPDRMSEFAKSASENGIKVIIAGAGGAAHLPGMVAAYTHLPVLGVPVESSVLKGMDSLLSIVQMPAGVPVATFAIGSSGAKNAALFAAEILAVENNSIRQSLINWRQQQSDKVAIHPSI
ncbi:5-(carboxyamino)imidazole ribonucleotide mutase [Alphaproteobacteria bacterium]|nr:5-(carboxyamino)imidazole ribonucleotide mutase [Alphaproteobacteria bacterium]